MLTSNECRRVAAYLRSAARVFESAASRDPDGGRDDQVAASSLAMAPSPETLSRALEGLTEVTIPDLARLLAIDPAYLDMAMSVRLGSMLAQRGWKVAGKRGGRPRVRFYRCPAAVQPPVDPGS